MIYEKTRLATFLSLFYKFQPQSVCCFCCCYFVCFETLEAEAQQYFWVERQRKVFFRQNQFCFFPNWKTNIANFQWKKILNDLLKREKMLSFYWWHILLIQAHLYLRQQCYGSLFLDSILFPKPLWVTLDQFEKQVMVEIKLGSLGSWGNQSNLLATTRPWPIEAVMS